MSAIIYQPAKTAMQSGKANAKKWVLKFLPEDTRSIEPLMGWSSNTDPNTQLKLEFKTLQEAEAFAQEQKIVYTVKQPNSATTKLQSYSDNFK